MKKGVVRYDADGLPICELCGKSFKRVLAHARQIHFINERDYKDQFGLDHNKGICSVDSSNLSRDRVYENFDKCIGKNLLNGGDRTRFKEGCIGRTRDMVSEQTRLALIKRLKTPEMVRAMKESGYRVGKSGLGNKKRWGTVKN